MKTSAELVKEVEAELNAVKAADMGIEAAQAFAQKAKDSFSEGDVVTTKDAIDNLVSLLYALRKAIPANVTPASAGPVGKSPHEHYLEQAHDVVKESLDHMRSTLEPLHKTLIDISSAVDKAVQATMTIKSVPKE